MQLPRSADALYCDRETLYLVEFKNGSLKETLGKRLNPKDDEELGINLGQRDALIEKCKDSVLICSDLWGKRTRWFREHCVFVLVYNEDKNKTALKRVASSIRKKARFGLPDKLKGFCVKDVLTLTEKEFSTSLLSTWRDAEEIAEVDAWETEKHPVAICSRYRSFVCSRFSFRCARQFAMSRAPCEAQHG